MNTPTKKLVRKSFFATGFFPHDASVILDKFNKPTPQRPVTPPLQSGSEPLTVEPLRVKAKSLLYSATRDNDNEAASALVQCLYLLSVQRQLLNHQLHGVREALQERKKQIDKSIELSLTFRDPNRPGGAEWRPPSSKREADAREVALRSFNNNRKREM